MQNYSLLTADERERMHREKSPCNKQGTGSHVLIWAKNYIRQLQPYFFLCNPFKRCILMSMGSECCKMDSVLTTVQRKALCVAGNIQ